MGEINNEKNFRFPKKDEKLAEFVGIMLGDGNITNYKHPTKKNRYYGIRITGHSKNDFDYLTHHVHKLIYYLFEAKASLYRSKKENAIQLYLAGKKVVNFLKNIGLKHGNKKRNNATIPSWIFKNKQFMKACLRGLIDTDGCVYLCGNGSTFPRINFCSNIEGIKRGFEELTTRLGYHPTPWSGKNTMIYRKKDIFKYWSEIGFSNAYHRNRFKALLP